MCDQVDNERNHEQDTDRKTAILDPRSLRAQDPMMEQVKDT